MLKDVPGLFQSPKEAIFNLLLFKYSKFLPLNAEMLTFIKHVPVLVMFYIFHLFNKFVIKH